MTLSPFEKSANELAASLRDFWWYHRTTMLYAEGGNFLNVWAEFREGEEPPPEIPKTFQGFRVTVSRVSKKRPCPFGSVKKQETVLE